MRGSVPKVYFGILLQSKIPPRFPPPLPKELSDSLQRHRPPLQEPPASSPKSHVRVSNQEKLPEHWDYCEAFAPLKDREENKDSPVRKDGIPVCRLILILFNTGSTDYESSLSVFPVFFRIRQLQTEKVLVCDP